MLPWRWLPPAHSPISWAAVLRPFRGRGSLEALRREVANRFMAEAVHFVDSGTSALALALLVARSATGRRAIAMPAYGCFDLATAADTADADVTLYDVDPRELSAAPASMARAARDVGAIVGVHLYGVPFDVDAMKRQAVAADAIFIEDAAQGAGATWRGRPAGAHGDLAVLSFGRGKGRSAGGGGALLVRNPALLADTQRIVDSWPLAAPARVGRALRMLGQDLLARPGVYALPSSIPALGLGKTPYHDPHPGARAAPSTGGLIEAALRLEGAESRVRQGRALRLLQLLPDDSGPRIPPEGVSGFLRLPLVLRSVDGRGSTAGRRLGIESGYPSALCDLPGFTRARWDDTETFDGARTLAARLITAPVHSRLTEADLERVADWLRIRLHAPSL